MLESFALISFLISSLTTLAQQIIIYQISKWPIRAKHLYKCIKPMEMYLIINIIDSK